MDLLSQQLTQQLLAVGLPNRQPEHGSSVASYPRTWVKWQLHWGQNVGEVAEF